MTTESAERAAVLAAHLARAYPKAYPAHIARFVVACQAAARASKRWETARCNNPLTEEQEAVAYRHIQRKADKLGVVGKEMANDPNAKAPIVFLGGDPRGCCGMLHIPGVRGDGWEPERGFEIY